MKKLFWGSCLLAVCGGLMAQTAPPKTHLKVGDTAPDFTMPGTNGKQESLSAYRGQKNVVLAFFPAAFTGGCTKEMLTYQAGLSRFEAMQTQVFGVSTDFIASQKKFAEELKAAFPLLSDHSRKVSKDYGVLMDNGLANRTTFVIDTAGKIAYIEEGKTAVDPSGAELACSRLKRK